MGSKYQASDDDGRTWRDIRPEDIVREVMNRASAIARMVERPWAEADRPLAGAKPTDHPPHWRWEQWTTNLAENEGKDVRVWNLRDVKGGLLIAVAADVDIAADVRAVTAAAPILEALVRALAEQLDAVSKLVPDRELLRAHLKSGTLADARAVLAELDAAKAGDR